VNQLHNKPAVAPGAQADEALARLFELAVVLFEAMERGLADRRLSRARAEVLWRLYHRGPMTQRELSQALNCTPRNVTGLLDALQADALVSRGPHPTDRRAVLVGLTEAGTGIVAALNTEHHEGAGYLFGDVPAADLASFVTTVDHVLARLRQADPASNPASTEAGEPPPDGDRTVAGGTLAADPAETG
jgi:DNA-binding MarR family transcriptional regulator